MVGDPRGGPITGNQVVPSSWQELPQSGPIKVAGDNTVALAVRARSKCRVAPLRLTVSGPTLFVDEAVVKASGKLPGQLTSFIGRESAVLMVCQRLQSDRFVTLVGSGGCGKTRLSLEVGRRVAEVRPDGVFFVDLSGLTEPGLVPNAVLQALGLRAAPGRDPVDVLVARLSKRELLLILDNCEHLLDVCASVASALASGCPGLWTLATSRQSLGVTGEIVVLVEGLELPDRGQVGGVDWVTRSEAGKLFIDRAARASPGFLVEDASAAFVAQICERLEGIPLAIELAAARTRLMSLRAIAEGLSDRFRLLVATGRAGPSRHRSLLASIEWSCSLLREDERALLWRLSVFASGFTLAAAEAVCSGNDIEPERVLGLLSSIVDKCLVQADPAADRFRLHDSMRAYAATALATEELGPTVRDRHFSYFSFLATSDGAEDRSRVSSPARSLLSNLISTTSGPPSTGA